MTVALKDSKLWETERGHGPGHPYKTFKLNDPRFFGIKGAHVWRDNGHWNWIYWDIASHEHRPQITVGYTSPELAAKAMIHALFIDADLIVQRINKLIQATA